MKTFMIGVLIILALLFLGFIGIYNKLIRMIEAIRNNQKQIDIQLDRRFKVFESLINTVKKYMDYEKTTLVDVISLRTQATTAAAAGDQKGRMEAENAISKIASNLNLVFEQYPNLKANENALQLQEEIVNTENKLTFAKQALNDSIERYNATKKSFIEGIVVFFVPTLNVNFEYWQLPEATVAEQEKYTVKF